MSRLSFDRRTLLGAGLAVAAALLVIVTTRGAQTSPVLVAASDIAPGVPIGADSLDVRQVAAPEGLVETSDPAAFAGWALAAPLAAGEPIPASLLRPEARLRHPDVVALALDEDHAVLGVLIPGDRVDVYVTASEPGGAGTSTSIVARNVFVVDVIAGPDGFGADRSARLLLAADGKLAAALIAAVHSGDVDLVRIGR